MRKALVVGINYYCNGMLNGCVPDAYNVKSVLEQHSDGTQNFGVMLMTATDATNPITKGELKSAVRELFRDQNEIALFYFSGHGHIENTGGYLITSDCCSGDDGLSMSDLLQFVNDSPALNKIVVLDTCHAGAMGNITNTSTTYINEGVTILTASAADQYSIDEGDGSTFTKLFVDALDGAAANLLGEISPGSVYAHIDQSLGPWNQRPIFRTNVKQFISLRRTQPPIATSELRKIINIFDNTFELQLDPSFEPDSDCPDEKNTEIFAILQEYNRVNLVRPIGTKHMYFAAMGSKKCKLTVVGEYYWNLIRNKLI